MRSEHLVYVFTVCVVILPYIIYIQFDYHVDDTIRLGLIGLSIIVSAFIGVITVIIVSSINDIIVSFKHPRRKRRNADSKR